MVKIPTIQETTEYAQFKTKRGNRGVSKSHVTRLVASLKEHNLLSSNPIIVNMKMEVIDGQHRLAAAKILKLPIFYVFFDPASLHEIQLLNATVKAWSAMDFLDSYITTGRQQYKVFKEMYTKWDFPFSASLRLLASPSVNQHGLHRSFRSGTYEVGDVEKANDIADVINRVLQYAHPAVRHSNPFYYTIMRLYSRDPHVVEKIIEKLAGGTKLYRLSTISEYLRQFEDVVNKDRYGSKPIRLY